MSLMDRVMSRENERPALRHKSSMESVKSIPMWDSSDPERAPPPLPLNPKYGESPTRGNASATIEAAAKALQERARANTGPSPYSFAPSSERSPERSPTRTPQNKRLHNLQNGGQKDSRMMLDNKPAEWSHSRPTTPAQDMYTSSPERSPTRSGLARADSGRTEKDLFGSTPSLARGARPSIRPLLSGGSPRSPTMLALQNMPYRDTDTAPIRDAAPVRDISVSSAIPAISYPTPSNLEAIHAQMLNLTNIATTLQKEMSALSRRSKDNATDLIGLKQATNSRDEDIRKSLKDLVASVKTTDTGLLGMAPAFTSSSRPASVFASHSPQYLDRRSYHSPPMTKSTSLPSLDYGPDVERATSPYSVEGAASVAMLEKILRDMVTKDGQDHLLLTLSSMLEKANQESNGTAKKVQELLEVVEQGSSQRNVMVRTGGAPKLEFDFEGSGVQTQDGSTNVLTKELQEVLQKLKDSVAQNGGMTGEVKNLVRELRGEVLGMGREIGRKLEEMPLNSAEEKHDAQLNQEQIRAIVQEGLSELKEQMAEVVQAKRRQSNGSVASRSMTVDNSSVYAVVKHALAEHTAEGQVNQDAILIAVREAYEAYKPEIELQQFGLERDEILQCLKEGLDDYQSSRATVPSSISRDEVLDAVQEALQHFQPPTATTANADLKEELFAVVKDCLDDHIAATRELTSTNTNQLTADQISEAIKTAMEQAQGAASTEQVLHSLHDILSGLREELGHYSANAGEQNEHVLQAVNNGLETLRIDVAGVVERAQDNTGADEVNQVLSEGIEQLKIIFADHAAKTIQSDTPTSSETLDLIKLEFDRLHEILTTQPRSLDGEHKAAMSVTLVGSIAELKSTIESRGIDDSIEEMGESLKAELDQLRETILQGTAAQKAEILETMHEIVENVQSRSSNDATVSTDEAITTLIKDEFDALKESLATSMMPVTNLDNKHDVTSTLRAALHDMAEQLSNNQNDAAAETLSVLKEEIHNLREVMVTSVVPATSTGANIELLEAIRDGLDGMRNYSSRSEVDAGTADALDSVRDELESMREVVKTAFISSGSTLSSGDTLEAIKQGLDDLKSKLDGDAVNGERSLDGAASMHESLNDVLTELKTDISKVFEKPIDMTMSYETLDLLKSGHSAILFEIERLRNDVESAQKEKDSQVALSEATSRETVGAVRPVSGEDLEKLEVMLAQLQIKIEAMDQNMQGSANTAGSATTLQAIANLEAMLEVLQATVAANAHRGQATAGVATKEDTDAIEVLLLNTKARLEEEILPAIKANVTKEDLDNLEALVRMTGDSVENVSSKLTGPILTKDDLVALEAVLQDVSGTMKAAKLNEGVSSAEIAVLQEICNTMKERMESLPAEGQVSAKADIDNVTELIATMQQDINKLHELHENDIGVTAKAFDDRKGESQTIVDQIAELKTVIEETQEEVKSRIKKSNKDVRALDEILQEIEDKMDNTPNAVSNVEELSEYVKAELGRTNTTLDTLSTALETSSKEILDKHTDVRAAIVVELSMKLDEQKAETARVADSINEVAEHLTSRVGQQEAILSESRALSEELKLTIDTLGASVTAINPALAEAAEKMTDDSRTVFNKIDSMHARLEADHIEDKDEHELTRAHLAKSLSAISLLREQLSEDHPKVMETLKSLLTMVSEHHEHLRDQGQASAGKLDRVLALPGLERSVSSTEVPTSFDNQHLHSKLDDLLKHAATSEKNVGNFAKLDEIHQQVTNTAGEVSAFVAFQTKMTTAVHDNKEDEAKQAAVNLSRSVAESQQLETKIFNLQSAKDDLAGDVEALMADRDALTAQKMRLTAEVASLQTAMEIRREEIEMMDARADALHRRIVEGVMNQSRALLMSKPGKRAVNMNLKRVSSNISRDTDATTTPSMLVSTGVGMTLQNKSPQRKDGAPLSSGGRRIVSLGQGSGNALPVGKRPLNISRNVTTGPLSLKRVQSIKSQKLRGAPNHASNRFEHDKENNGVDTQDFQQLANPTHAPSTIRSDSYTESHGGRSVSYGTQASEHSDASGSYLSGSELSDRRTSYGFSEASVNRRDRQSIGSTIRTDQAGQSEYADSIYEDDEDEEDEEQDARSEQNREGSPSTVLENDHQHHEEVQTQKKEGRRVGDSDSGLGSDLPTAALSAGDFNGYFPENQQETMEA